MGVLTGTNTFQQEQCLAFVALSRAKRQLEVLQSDYVGYQTVFTDYIRPACQVKQFMYPHGSSEDRHLGKQSYFFKGAKLST